MECPRAQAIAFTFFSVLFGFDLVCHRHISYNFWHAFTFWYCSLNPYDANDFFFGVDSFVLEKDFNASSVPRNSIEKHFFAVPSHNNVISFSFHLTFFAWNMIPKHFRLICLRLVWFLFFCLRFGYKKSQQIMQFQKHWFQTIFLCFANKRESDIRFLLFLIFILLLTLTHKNESP